MKDKAQGFYLVPGDGKARCFWWWKLYWSRYGRYGSHEMVTLKWLYRNFASLNEQNLGQLRKIFNRNCLITAGLKIKGEMASVTDGGNVECPPYYGSLLNEVLATEAGLQLFQELCGCKDDAKALMDFFVKLSTLQAEHIKVYTPSMEERESTESWAAALAYCNGNDEYYTDFGIVIYEDFSFSIGASSLGVG